MSTPRSFHGSCAGSLLRQHLELIAADLDGVAGGADRHGEVAEHRVVLQQVSQRRGVGDVVDGDDVDVVMRQRRAHDVAADPSEPVDANLNGHECVRRDSQTKFDIHVDKLIRLSIQFVSP